MSIVDRFRSKLSEAICELADWIEHLEAKNNELKAKNEKLKDELYAIAKFSDNHKNAREQARRALEEKGE